MTAAAPGALIMPGMDGTGRLLTGFRHALAPAFDARIVAWPRDAGGYGELLPLARARLPAKDRFILIAESFSGPLAIRLAAERPPGLAGLVLCASFASAPRRWARMLRPLLRLPLPQPPAAMAMPWMMGPWSTPAWTRQVREAMAGVDAAAARHRLRAILEVDARADLSRVACPLLYLQASEDRLVPPRCWHAIQAVKPDARMARVPGPHFLLQASPEAAACAIVHAFGPAPSPAARTHAAATPGGAT